MKRYLAVIIIVVVAVGAIALTRFLIRNSESRNGANTVLEPAKPPVADNRQPSSQPQPESSGAAAKPGEKVTSPVVVQEFGDYQCPPCGSLYPDLKKIETEYGNKIRFEFHYFPLTKIHKNAMTAARAAEAARVQNKFWEMHDRLYRNQKAWVDLDDPRSVFVSYARELGINAAQFQSDMESNRVEQAIVADIERASALGVTGTPTIIIEGQQLRAESTNPEGIRQGINLMLERKAAS